MSEMGTILIADDEETFLEATADLLRRAGYLCDTASNGQDALARLSEREYDLLIADIRMPGNSNLELAHEIADSDGPVPIVLVTGYPSLQTAVESLELPVVGYLTKPFEQNEMYFQISRGVARGRLQSMLRRERFRAERDLEHSRLAEANLAYHDDLARCESVEAYVSGAYQRISATLADLRSLQEVTLSHRRSGSVCAARQCPRQDEMRGLAASTEQLLSRLEADTPPELRDSLQETRSRLAEYLRHLDQGELPH